MRAKDSYRDVGMEPTRHTAIVGATCSRASCFAIACCALLLGGCLHPELCHRSPRGLAKSLFAGPPSQYEALLGEADKLDRDEDPRSVDVYYRVALDTASVGESGIVADEATRELWIIHQQALRGLIDTGQRYQRLNPGRQLLVHHGVQRVVPITYHGFAWKPADFTQLSPADLYPTGEITERHCRTGWGLPLVAMRIARCPDELFLRERQPWAVTAVLKPDNCRSGDSVLEFYNSCSHYSFEWNGQAIGLAGDVTAPLAALVKEAPRSYLQGFTAPAETALRPKLIVLEPYQRGKIPVILIHGLYSDAITWADTVNDLRAQRDLYQQFQFWVFRYPTGGEVLASASELRRQMQLARDLFAPAHDDPALDQMVLVGHSLGGLVSEMQVTTSHDILWRKVADQPFSALKAPPEIEERLSRGFFYEAQPYVTCVVYIGTPFRGSSMARRLVGVVSSRLVNFGSEEDAAYKQLMADNPGVFKPMVTRRRPTTINMLDPDSPLLEAFAEMPVSPDVRKYGIIGTGGVKLVGEATDGVVSVSSAQVCGAVREVYVPAKHEKLHRDPESIAELARILREHAARVGPAAIGANKPQRAQAAAR